MFVRYNYRLKPTPEQDQLLRQVAGSQRWLWNHFLAQEIKQYKKDKSFNFYNKNAASLPSLKKDYEWLKDGPSQSLQQTLKDLNNALSNSFKKPERGFPKFKKKKEFNETFRVVQTPEKWKGKYGHIYIDIPKIGKVKWNYHRSLPNTFSTATVLLDGDKWYISIVIDVETKQPVDIKNINQVVGIDLNSKMLVVTSDGELIDNPKFFKQQKQRIAKKQRQISKKTKGSNRYKRKQKELYNAHKNARHQRTNHLHQVSNQITNDYDLICTEDLNVKGIQQFNGTIVNDAGWSRLLEMIKYKSLLKGKHMVQIHRFAPSSKTCNHCGTMKTIKLSERTYSCENCGTTLDRDINAALNIRDWGLFDFNTPGTGEIYRRGDTSVGVDKSGHLPTRYVSLNRQKFQSNMSLEAK